MTNERINFSAPIQNDDVFVTSSIQSIKGLTGLDGRKGLENAVISNGKIVNVVSKGYGHLPNELFYTEIERKLIGADIDYTTRSINRNDCSFSVDYILNSDKYVVNVKNGIDKIKPMLRFVNSYDGSNKTVGKFGFFREVCSNGLHVTKSIIGFAFKHRGDIQEIVLPEIGLLINTFMDNEFYSIKRKFEILSETKISNTNEWVEKVCNDLGIFKFEKSDKNPEPRLNAQLVIDTINREKSLLGEQANLWLGYNAFNEWIHGKLIKSFEAQQNLDSKLFQYVTELV